MNMKHFSHTLLTEKTRIYVVHAIRSRKYTARVCICWTLSGLRAVFQTERTILGSICDSHMRKHAALSFITVPLALGTEMEETAHSHTNADVVRPDMLNLSRSARQESFCAKPNSL